MVFSHAYILTTRMPCTISFVSLTRSSVSVSILMRNLKYLPTTCGNSRHVTLRHVTSNHVTSRHVIRNFQVLAHGLYDSRRAHQSFGGVQR